MFRHCPNGLTSWVVFILLVPSFVSRRVIFIFDDWFVALYQAEFVSTKNYFHFLLLNYYDNLLTVLVVRNKHLAFRKGGKLMLHVVDSILHQSFTGANQTFIHPNVTLISFLIK